MTRKRSGVLTALRPYLKGGKGLLIAACCAAALSVALSLTAPLLVGKAIDQLALGGADLAGLLPILIVLLCVYLLAAGFQWLLTFCANALCYRTVQALRGDVFSKIHRLPFRVLDAAPHGDVVARLTADAEAVGDGLLQGAAQFLTGAATIAGTMVFLLSISGWVALVVALLTPLSVLVARKITGRSHHLFRAQSDAQGDLTAFVSERAGNQKLSLLFSQERRSQAAFDEINGRLRLCGYKAQLYGALINPLTRFVNHLVYIAVGVVGGLIALSGGLTVGAVSACLTYANQYTKPFNEISSVMTQLQSALAAFQRIQAFLAFDEESPDATGQPVQPVRGEIAFRDVAFGYRPDQPLITNLNQRVQPGQKVAIVGPTGAGKTTLVNLLMRFYDVDSGDILIDGRSVSAMSRDSLRRMFGMVLQDSWLRQGTVRENIAYGRPTATDDEIIAAAKAAHAHSFIMRLPNGYDTVIGQGASLSQGQTQLLCIARVMLCDPPLLILDEATSAIDTRTELKISAAFDAMMRGRTAFVVAHRLSTIREADVILVLRDGKVVEQGTHAQLLSQGGFYRTLYDSQFSGAQEESA